jgi:hypothetical protein
VAAGVDALVKTPLARIFEALETPGGFNKPTGLAGNFRILNLSGGRAGRTSRTIRIPIA